MHSLLSSFVQENNRELFLHPRLYHLSFTLHQHCTNTQTHIAAIVIDLNYGYLSDLCKCLSGYVSLLRSGLSGEWISLLLSLCFLLRLFECHFVANQSYRFIECQCSITLFNFSIAIQHNNSI
jgi:hypothetical protein